jgi:hypothetical protein
LKLFAGHRFHRVPEDRFHLSDLCRHAWVTAND